MRTAYVWLLMALLALAAAGPRAEAAPPPSDLDRLRQMVQGLGYKMREPLQDEVGIEVDSDYVYAIYFQPDSKTGSLYIHTNLLPFAPDRMPAAIGIKLLTFNDSNADYFSLGKTGRDLRVVLWHNATIAAMSPMTLRSAVQGLVDEADSTSDLWDPDKWSKPRPPSVPSDKPGVDACTGQKTSCHADAAAPSVPPG